MGSMKQNSNRAVARVFSRLFACVLIPVLWIGLPAVAGAQSANDKKADSSPDSSYERQLQASPGQTKTGSAKVTPDQPQNSFIQYGDVWGCNDGFDKSGTECVSIFSEIGGQPENSYVQYGTIWGCTRGFSREGNRCVSIFTKKRVILQKKKDGMARFFSSQ